MRRSEHSAINQPASGPAAADRFIELPASPLNPGVSPVRLRVRTCGDGAPLLILHGGWGARAYPFDRQVEALAAAWRIVLPDRSGYGGSGRLSVQDADFHHRAAAETLTAIDALGLDRPVLWGHSDGAVIALLMALDAPDRVRAVIAESTHFFRRKPASRAFFETMRDRPDDLGPRATAALAEEHGDGWRQIVSINGEAWLRIGEQGGDLYDGRLSGLRVPLLIVHGGRDPRTEPGELEALRGAASALASNPVVRVALCPDAGHSPHSAPASADEVTRIVTGFLSELAAAAAPADRR